MQWHQRDHMQTMCTSLQTDNHTNTSSLNFYRPDALSDAQPRVSKHWRHYSVLHTNLKYHKRCNQYLHRKFFHRLFVCDMTIKIFFKHFYKKCTLNYHQYYHFDDEDGNFGSCWCFTTKSTNIFVLMNQTLQKKCCKTVSWSSKTGLTVEWLDPSSRSVGTVMSVVQKVSPMTHSAPGTDQAMELHWTAGCLHTNNTPLSISALRYERKCAKNYNKWHNKNVFLKLQ